MYDAFIFVRPTKYIVTVFYYWYCINFSMYLYILYLNLGSVRFLMFFKGFSSAQVCIDLIKNTEKNCNIVKYYCNF